MERKIIAYYNRPPGLESIIYLRSLLLASVQLTTADDGPAPAGMNILICGQPEREILENNNGLRAVIIPWSGVPAETRQMIASFPEITLHNLHHNAAPVAELALALLLAVAKFIVPLDQSLRKNNWSARSLSDKAMLLEGKTALILGYGAIGRRVATNCYHLGMKVWAIRRHPDSKPELEDILIYPPEALHSVLPSADVLMICLPHTQDTDGFIGQIELDLLPASAVVVNIGRGAIIDEAALFASLHDGRILGAGLDVWYNYPENDASRANTPPSNLPFHELDNVVMSPHRGGESADTNRLRMMHLASLLNAAAEGKTIPNRVDLNAGY